MRLLALDFGILTGWAAWNAGTRLENGEQLFDLKRGESPGMRYLRFNAWLAEMIRLHQPELIVYEQTLPTTTAFAGAQTRELASGFATRVQEVCAKLDIQHTAVYPATLKKFATGKGNAKKPQMIEAVRKRWAPWARGDNECDAIAMIYWVLADLGLLPEDGREAARDPKKDSPQADLLDTAAHSAPAPKVVAPEPPGA